jgi:hypothetical protein
MDLYLILLGVLVLLVLGGGLLRKLLKKADIDLSDDQLDAATKAVVDAVEQVEAINRKLVASGGKPMSDAEKLEVTSELAKDLAVAAGVSQIKVEVLLKLLQAALKKSEEMKKAAAPLGVVKPKRVAPKAKRRRVVPKKAKKKKRKS